MSCSIVLAQRMYQESQVKEPATAPRAHAFSQSKGRNEPSSKRHGEDNDDAVTARDATPPARARASFQSTGRSGYGARRQNEDNYSASPAQQQNKPDTQPISRDFVSLMSRQSSYDPAAQENARPPRKRQFRGWNAPEDQSVAMQSTDWRALRPQEPLNSIPENEVPAGANKGVETINLKTEGPHQEASERLDSRWARKIFKWTDCEGLIVRSAVHEQDYKNAKPQYTVDWEEGCTVVTKFGMVYSKLRWQVIVAKRCSHYVTVPLFTHGGNGLENRSEEEKMEYVSIRDQRHNGPFQNLTPHRRIEANMEVGTTQLKPESVIRISYTLNGKYNLPVEVLGRLTSSQLTNLQQLCDQVNKFSR